MLQLYLFLNLKLHMWRPNHLNEVPRQRWIGQNCHGGQNCKRGNI